MRARGSLQYFMYLVHNSKIKKKKKLQRRKKQSWCVSLKVPRQGRSRTGSPWDSRCPVPPTPHSRRYQRTGNTNSPKNSDQVLQKHVRKQWPAVCAWGRQGHRQLLNAPTRPPITAQKDRRAPSPLRPPITLPGPVPPSGVAQENSCVPQKAGRACGGRRAAAASQAPPTPGPGYSLTLSTAERTPRPRQQLGCPRLPEASIPGIIGDERPESRS